MFTGLICIAILAICYLFIVEEHRDKYDEDEDDDHYDGGYGTIIV